MLASILILLGLAPAGAGHNQCLMPTWTIAHPTAIACDVKDATLGGHDIGTRTGLAFKRSGPNHLGYVLVYANVSSDKDAAAAAKLVGPNGGTVVHRDKIESPLKLWGTSLSGFGLDRDAAPTGAVVYLVPPPASTTTLQ